MLVSVTYLVFDDFSTVERQVGDKVAFLQFLQYLNSLTLKMCAEPFRQFLCGANPFTGINGVADAINTAVGCTEISIAA